LARKSSTRFRFFGPRSSTKTPIFSHLGPFFYKLFWIQGLFIRIIDKSA